MSTKYHIFCLKLSVNLFTSNHLFKLHNSEFNKHSTSRQFFPVQKIFVSSANKTNFNNLDVLQRSLIYNRNSIGPKIYPCGTPQVIDNFSESTLL